MRIELLSLTPGQLRGLLESLDEPAFRAEQILDWVWKKRVGSIEQMSNLSDDLRAKLAACCTLRSARLVDRHDSRDDTTKLLLELADGQSTETVLIPTEHRATACVSTQVGCAMGCRFCASGLDGLVRDMTAGEIIEQILHLSEQTGRTVTNVVFMGMGEPLANFAATVEAVHAIVDPQRLGLSARHVTISTVGLPAAIRRLGQLQLPITLAISLHAPNDALRQELIPLARQISIDEIISACQEFYQTCHREITLEYTLLAGVNDSYDCADQLARLSRRLRCNVNLIRYNPVATLPYQPPPDKAVEAFARRCRDGGANVQVRRSRGTGSAAACGQLRQRKIRR
ncbi:MAG: 23S rRNA (adenine(2503)-C(2))-methyltransferase RlmN [Phycisphaerae bacterium]